nr:hypothetical protein [Streptomyces halstedii]
MRYRLAVDRGEPAPTAGEQVRGRLACRCGVVDGHVRAGQVMQPLAEQDERGAGRGPGDGRVVLGERAEDDAVYQRVGAAQRDVEFQLGPAAGGLHITVWSRDAAWALQLRGQFSEVGHRQVRHGQRQYPAASGTQPPYGRVGPVAQFVDGPHDTLAGGLGETAGCPDDVGHRPPGHTGMFRNGLEPDRLHHRFALPTRASPAGRGRSRPVCPQPAGPRGTCDVSGEEPSHS